MSSSKRARIDSFTSTASDGAPWLGSSQPSLAIRRRNSSVPRMVMPEIAGQNPVDDRPEPTFEQATTASIADVLQDNSAVLRKLLEFVLTVFVVSTIMIQIDPRCIEPCPPAPLHSGALRASPSTSNWTSAQQPAPIASSIRSNIVKAVADYGKQQSGVIASHLIPSLWSNFWPESTSDQQKHKFDPYRARGWERIINKGKSMATINSLLADLDGLGGTLYREFGVQHSQASPKGNSGTPVLAIALGRIGIEHSDIMKNLNRYEQIRKRAAEALADYRHPDSDGKQLAVSVKDLNTLRKALMKVGSELNNRFDAAEKRIDFVLKEVESLPWHEEKDKRFGGYWYRSMIAAVDRLKQYDGCVKTMRGMITSDIHVLR